MSYQRDNLREIVHESITPEYGRGKYGDIEVIIMMKNGYINATKLCQLGGKRFAKYSENEAFKNLLNECMVSGNLPTNELKIVINGGSDPISTAVSGTYVHWDLIPHIASWVNSRFGIMVSRIVNEHIVREYREQIKVKDTRIDELLSEVRGQSKKIDHLIYQNEHLLQDNEQLLNKCDIMNDNLDFTMEKLIDTADISVPSTNNDLLKEEFILIKRDPKADNDIYNYSVIRAQTRSINGLLRVQRRRHPELQIIYRINSQANSVNLFNRFKQTYPNASFAGTSIRLNNVSEASFIREIRDLHESRKDVVNEAARKLDEDEKATIGNDFKEQELKEEEPPLPAEAVPTQPLEDEKRVVVDGLLKLTVKKLKEICRQNGYSGYSTLVKSALITHILECQ